MVLVQSRIKFNYKSGKVPYLYHTHNDKVHVGYHCAVLVVGEYLRYSSEAVEHSL